MICVTKNSMGLMLIYETMHFLACKNDGLLVTSAFHCDSPDKVNKGSCVQYSTF